VCRALDRMQRAGDYSCSAHARRACSIAAQGPAHRQAARQYRRAHAEAAARQYRSLLQRLGRAPQPDSRTTYTRSWTSWKGDATARALVNILTPANIHLKTSEGSAVTASVAGGGGKVTTRASTPSSRPLRRRAARHLRTAHCRPRAPSAREHPCRLPLSRRRQATGDTGDGTAPHVAR